MRLLLALFALTALVLLAGNQLAHVFDRDEARFALAVREMAARGDWILPTNWGEPRYHKPILSYWCALASARVLGAGEFAWRLPSVLSGLATLALTVSFAWRRFGAEVALRAGAVLASSLVFVVETKILTADALLLATTTLAFFAWSELRERPAQVWRWQLVFWVALALGILAKGVNVVFLVASAAALSFLGELRAPERARGRRIALGALALASLLAALPGLGLGGPVLAAGVAAWCLTRPGPRVALGTSFGLPLCLALVGAWFVPALVRSHGAFLSESLGHHMLARSAVPFEGHAGFPGYYLLAALVAFFPWALRLPRALRAAWRDPRCEFLLAWVLGPWVLLECLASKLPHYLLITLPAVALLIALHGKKELARNYGLAVALQLALFLFALPRYEERRLSPALGREVARVVQPGEPILLFGYRPASLGRELPDGHRVVQDLPAFERELQAGLDGLFLVTRERESELVAAGDGNFEELARVGGLDGFRWREVVLLRRSHAHLVGSVH